MGDPRRFSLMAEMIAAQFPNLKSAPVADVAGGKGYLNTALRQRGFADVTSWDKRPNMAKGRRGFRYGYFDHRTAPDGYRLVVGMHPDGGTDQIVTYACKHGAPFAVCPCCIVPTAESYFGPNRYSAWVDHLAKLAERRGMQVDILTLPMQGRAEVIVGRPRRNAHSEARHA